MSAKLRKRKQQRQARKQRRRVEAEAEWLDRVTNEDDDDDGDWDYPDDMIVVENAEGIPILMADMFTPDGKPTEFTRQVWEYMDEQEASSRDNLGKV